MGEGEENPPVLVWMPWVRREGGCARAHTQLFPSRNSFDFPVPILLWKRHLRLLHLDHVTPL